MIYRNTPVTQDCLAIMDTPLSPTLILCLFKTKPRDYTLKMTEDGLKSCLPMACSFHINLLSLPVTITCLCIWCIMLSGWTWHVESQEFGPGTYTSSFIRSDDLHLFWEETGSKRWSDLAKITQLTLWDKFCPPTLKCTCWIFNFQYNHRMWLYLEIMLLKRWLNQN
jgi:hypothetical protein